MHDSVRIVNENIAEDEIVCATPKMVVVCDTSGNPMILVVKIADGTWGISTSADPDWGNILKRYGVTDEK